MTGRVLISGASGKIGMHGAAAFEAAGWEVRRFVRGTDMRQSAVGCDVILNGMNPPNYHNWAEAIPRITEEVIAAAEVNGATVILPGNVYVYGMQEGVLSEDTPHRPCSRKGRIRAEMEARYRTSNVQVINLRAGNFIDPNRQGDVLSIMVTAKLGKGRLGLAGRSEAVQPWAYLPDWARAAVMLAERREALARYEDVPFAGHALTHQALKRELEALLGRRLRDVRFPWWVMRLAAPFWELARELNEMRYLWDLPHELSGEKLARLLPEFEATSLRKVLAASIDLDIHPDEAVAAGAEGGVMGGRCGAGPVDA